MQCARKPILSIFTEVPLIPACAGSRQLLQLLLLPLIEKLLFPRCVTRRVTLC